MISPIRRRRDGRYAVRLPTHVRTLLASLARQMDPMIDSDDPAFTRLFPPAYIGDGSADAERQYRTLVDGALRNYHHRATQVLIDTVGADSLSAEEMAGWLSAIESMRLVIGTRLDVSEGMDELPRSDPPEPEQTVYDLLGMLQAAIIDVVAAEFPDEGDPARGL
ncbi:MAG: DUF2017 family protein [Acidimicrobiales bacterium]